MGLIKEFKEFAIKGNVLDLAVGIIIGAAFGKVVSSFVNDVLMPPIGLLVGGINFSDLAVTLKAGTAGGEPVLLKYGQFVQATIDFAIVAFAVFMMVKVIIALRRQEVEKPTAPPAPTREESLLAEIRDLLKQRT